MSILSGPSDLFVLLFLIACFSWSGVMYMLSEGSDFVWRFLVSFVRFVGSGSSESFVQGVCDLRCCEWGV